MVKNFTRAVLLVCSTFALSDCVSAQDDAVDVDPSVAHRSLLHVCKIDGTPLRPLVADKEFRHKLDRQGSPEVSADGKLVAFDAWSSDKGTDWQEGRICVVNFDGTNAKDLSDGNMPSFSPDGSKLVFTRCAKNAQEDGANGSSTWMIDSDGKNKKMLVDGGTWGARLSPDGKSVVFYGGVDEEGESVKTNCLRLYDIETGKVSNVFSPSKSPFSRLNVFYKWTEEKKRTVAFGGRLKIGRGTALATIDVDKGLDSLSFIEMGADGHQILGGQSFDWHPKDDSLLGTKYVDGKPVLVSVPTDEDKSETKRLFEGVPEDVGVHDPVYTPDAENIIASLRPK